MIKKLFIEGECVECRECENYLPNLLSILKEKHYLPYNTRNKEVNFEGIASAIKACHLGVLRCE